MLVGREVDGAILDDQFVGGGVTNTVTVELVDNPTFLDCDDKETPKAIANPLQVQ
jgi:hypothetical protein